ncbi:hypothetical protein CC80DRAFT_471072 [Byssothecium circinans]|uniref:25S rRNA (uridine-N(3))-methyltransferase BMT5-like domain-containing protein n=1 Tax=Byssothecium circinans TaxID=147558 RepID=A0A6A5TYY1_9PLEO|nr:hypothetical protein CC80DRAFT_471072 [Byssothecium circinans]
MSKTKTKKHRRELKRDSARKIAAARRKTKSQSTTTKPPSTTPHAPSKKHKHNPNPTATTTPSKPTPAPAPKPHTQASQKPPMPFGVYDKILLVGEGDFSFTRSLVVSHGCANVTATSYDSEAEVRRKYPSFEAVEKELSGLTPAVPLFYGVDAGKLGGYKGGEGGWDTIAFMFPHTGGLTTDVNRQARANQALLISFFTACLSPSSSPAKRKTPPRAAPAPFLKTGGKVVVALFEGEAYELWCIRNLARHVGLKVVGSWRFEWGEYPGYAHVRTVGTLEGGGGWRGEERAARLYVFEKVADGGGGGEGVEKRKKKGKGRRGRGDSGSASENSEDEGD